MKNLILLLLTFSIYSTVIAQRPKLTIREMNQDIDILYSSWTTLHPGLYRYISDVELKKLINELKGYCKEEKTHKEFYLALAQLCEKIRCGHSFLNPVNLSNESKNLYLPKNIIPLFFSLDDKRKIIVTENLSDNNNIKVGDEIVSINGIESKRIIDSLLKVSRSDGLNSIEKKLFNINETVDEIDSYSLFDVFFPLYFSENDKMELLIKPSGKKQVYEVRLSLVDLKQRMQVYVNKYGEIPSGKKSWDYKIIDSSTSYMKFGTFAFWNENFNSRKYIDSIFSFLNDNKKIKNLVIDIRNNEGGDNSGDYILSYLTKDTIACNGNIRRFYRYLSIPDSLKKHLDTWDNSFKNDKEANRYTKTTDGLYEINSKEESCLDIIPQEKRFSGKLFLITNAKNSSAAFEMARNVKFNNLGIIVGETTGGSLQGINGGEFFFLTLPNSKIEIDIPLIFQSPKIKSLDSGIRPDIIVKTTQKSIYKREDAQLNYILDKLIQK